MWFNEKINAMYHSKFHIGNTIKEQVARSPLTVTGFAKSVHLSRSGVYKLFARKFIGTDQLKQISLILEHDFFSYYNSPAGFKKDPLNAVLATKNDMKDLERAIQQLSDKM